METDPTPPLPSAEVPSTDSPILGFPVVGIGASAGGFPALVTLLQNLPPSPGLALVVILHLARLEPSGAARVLQSATEQPVVQVNHTTRILPNHVYVIPPDRSLRMVDGHLLLDELNGGHGRPVAIDNFFRTLAEGHREYGIGVVLSGMGSDGTAGLAAIREAGGVTIAQLPSDAEEGSMPRAAIESGMADFVLTAAQIPAKLIALRDIASTLKARTQVAPQGSRDTPFDMGPDPHGALQGVLSTLRTHTGHDFTQYKQSTLVRRIERRLQVRGMPDLPSYLYLLQKDSSEPKALLKDLLVGVTGFFRDREAFEALERLVLPRILAAHRPGRQVRAWVPACSTGEEAYSLAMGLADHASALADPPGLQIFATDIDEHAVMVARAGLYPLAIAEDMPEGRVTRHFVKEGDRYKARKVLREHMLFTRHNLLQDPAFSRVDLISCRNFLIYLNREMHRQVLQRFHFALNPGGYLFLGSAESADVASDLFRPVSAQHRIYQAIPGVSVAGRVPVPATMAPPRAPLAPVDAVAGEGRRARLFSFEEIHQHKAAEFTSPSILVNAEGKIVHVAERATPFLRQVGGEPTHELVALVLPELQLALQAALFRAQKSGRHERTGMVHYRHGGETRAVDMHAWPFEDEHAEGGLILVQFQELHDVQQPRDADPRDATLSHQLEEELRQTRRTLHETIDRADTFDIEMRVYCEELQTTVAELRAANVEIERDKSLLQSGRLELAAVNDELRNRIDATGKAHDDLSNLIASSDVATVFLDNALRIQRYTPRFADIFNVIPADIGRPLPDITNTLDAPGLTDEALHVFQTLLPMEREARSRDGKVYLVRVHPYRTAQDRIEGAVMTLFDITLRKRSEAALRETHARLTAVFDGLTVGVGVFDTQGVLVLSNQEMDRYLPDRAMPSRAKEGGGRWRAYHPDGRPMDADDFPGARALRGERVVPGMEMLYTADDGSDIRMQVSSVPVIDDEGRIAGQVAVIINIDALARGDMPVPDLPPDLQPTPAHMRIAPDNPDTEP